jgi:hypothetical protein
MPKIYFHRLTVDDGGIVGFAATLLHAGNRLIIRVVIRSAI